MYKNHDNYQEIPPGSYPSSEHARYDGRYIYDHEAPPRPPLPDETGESKVIHDIMEMHSFSFNEKGPGVPFLAEVKWNYCRKIYTHIMSSSRFWHQH